MSHICPCTPCPSPPGYRSKVESRHFAHHWLTSCMVHRIIMPRKTLNVVLIYFLFSPPCSSSSRLSTEYVTSCTHYLCLHSLPYPPTHLSTEHVIFCMVRRRWIVRSKTKRKCVVTNFVAQFPYILPSSFRHAMSISLTWEEQVYWTAKLGNAGLTCEQRYTGLKPECRWCRSDTTNNRTVLVSAGMPDCPASGQSGTRMRKNTVAGTSPVTE